MGYQIIKQPRRSKKKQQLYAVWSTFSDELIGWDETKESVVEWFIEMARDRARKDTELIIYELENNKRPYFQFTKTWDEVKRHKRK